jgi:hypothetical protein
MNKTGTREKKRARKATPPPLGKPIPLGCVATFWLYLILCLIALGGTHRLAWLAAGAPGLLIAGFAFIRVVRRLALLAAVRSQWTSTSIRCLVVYSKSAVWESHIRTEWLPRLGSVAVTLDWSQRASWGNTLAVRVFKYFCGTYRNFNPAVVVFRGFRQPLVFRFYTAFKEAKGGRGDYLAEYEQQMFSAALVAA